MDVYCNVSVVVPRDASPVLSRVSQGPFWSCPASGRGPPQFPFGDLGKAGDAAAAAAAAGLAAQTSNLGNER